MKLGLKTKKEEIEKVFQKTKNFNKDWIKGKNFLKINSSPGCLAISIEFIFSSYNLSIVIVYSSVGENISTLSPTSK